VTDELADRLARFRGVSLARLDERAALLRRVDRKYAVERDRLLELLELLQDDHEVLEIDGQRSFAYRSVYFDTPNLRCFWDHVLGRVPRFKARTRLYRDTGNCVFEVKLKRSDEEMEKRQVEHPVERDRELTEAAIRCLREALSDAGLGAPADLAPSLHTSFRRITLAAIESAERLTCDLDVRLSSPQGRAATLAGSIVLLETKTERGDGRANRSLGQLGVEEISLSKYRVGISLVGNTSTDDPQPGGELFAAG
jgi:VTC domain